MPWVCDRERDDDEDCRRSVKVDPSFETAVSTLPASDSSMRATTLPTFTVELPIALETSFAIVEAAGVSNAIAARLDRFSTR